MGATEELKYSVEEYLALDEAGEKEGKRYEFHDGEVFLVSDASIQHNQVLNAAASSLSYSLKGKPCQILSSSQKVNVQKKSFYCYPDILAVCGKIETLGTVSNIITNPTVIIEILSASTQDYDRGEKFRLYRNIASLKEYICLSSLRISMEMYVRQPNDFWVLKEYNALTDSITIASLELQLSLGEVYEKVTFEENYGL